MVITLAMTQAMINLGALGSTVFPGDARLVVWTLAWDNHAILDGVPLFDANVFYPAEASLQYNDHLVGLSLFTLPVYATTRNPVVSYNIVWILSFVLNALAMHALAFRHTRSHAAAATSALVFTFSFYKMLHAHGHLSQIWTWLVPLSVLLLERWLERPTFARILAWTAAIVLQALASWYLAVMVGMVNAIALAWWAIVHVRDRWGRRAAHLTLAAALMAAAVWPFAVKYRTLDPPPPTQVVSLSADWADYVRPPDDTLVGRVWGASVYDEVGSIWGERTIFLGWIAIGLAAAGAVVLLIRREWTRAGVALTCVAAGLALAIGPSGGGAAGRSAFDLLTSIPGMAGFRAPARFALVVLFGVSLLAAEPVRAAVARAGRSRNAWLWLLWPLMLAEWFVVSMPNGRPPRVDIPAIYRTPEIRSARALVSLPVYRDTPQWWLEPDYMYFSTAHWRPIVNGLGRSEPPGHPHVMSYVNAFPGPNNARRMRELGIEYIVLHGAAYPAGVDDVVQAVRNGKEYELVRQIGTDYLIRVRNQ